MRLAIIRTHPTQYFAPLFRYLAKIPGLRIKVFYVLKNRGQGEFDPDFNQEVTWDVSLLEGYDYEWVPPSPLPFKPKHVFECRSPRLIERLKEEKFDAIFCAGYALWLDWQVLLFAIGNKIPLICRPELNETPHPRGVLKTWLRTQFLSWYFSKISAFLFIGDKAKKDFLNFGGEPSKTFFSPYSIENDRFAPVDPTSANKKALRKAMGFNECDLVLLYVGKLIPHKGVDLLVEALSILIREKKYRIGMMIVGDGPKKTSILEKFHKINLQHFHFAGFQNQSHLPNYYYAADVLVVPSVKEPWGLVVNEAMASGTPVIASDCVGASYDLIEVGKTGYVFKSNDQESLAKTLVRFYETFSQSGFSSDYIRSKVSAFNIENSASGFVEALRSIKNRNLF